MTRYFIATFSAGTRQFLMTADDDPPPYPAFVEADEDIFMEQRRQRNRERKADKRRAPSVAGRAGAFHVEPQGPETTKAPPPP